MNKLLIIFSLIGIIVLPFNINAQDFRFSQYNENSAIVNPALTGNTSVLKASLSYKEQWKTVTVPYKTYGLSVESRFKTSGWKEVPGQSMRFTKNSFNRFTGGLSFYSDKAGDGNLTTTQVNLSLATHVPLNKNSNLSLGFQGSIVQRKLDFGKLVFSNQYNGTKYDASMANGENSAARSFIYPDLGAGLAWNFREKENRATVNNGMLKRATVGFAMYHLNKPRQSYFVDNSPKINFKYVIHGDFLLPIKSTNVAIAPSYLLQLQATNYEIVGGTSIKYFFKNNSKYTGFSQSTTVSVGAYYRYKDALIIAFGYDRNQQLGIGISYDFNLSGLTPASKSNGGPEITLRFNTSNPYLYQKRSKAKM